MAKLNYRPLALALAVSCAGKGYAGNADVLHNYLVGNHVHPLTVARAIVSVKNVALLEEVRQIQSGTDGLFKAVYAGNLAPAQGVVRLKVCDLLSKRLKPEQREELRRLLPRLELHLVDPALRRQADANFQLIIQECDRLIAEAEKRRPAD